MEENPNRILWVDVETTGLEPYVDKLLEFGAILTDNDLRPLAAVHAMIDAGDVDKLRMTQHVLSMHTTNGLLDDLRLRGAQHTVRCAMVGDVPGFGTLGGIFVEAGLIRPRDLDEELARLIQRYDAVSAPLGGSNVGFDRRMMEANDFVATLRLLHYRNIDVSSLRSVMRRWCPGISIPDKSTKHRVFDDLAVSIASAAAARKRLATPDVEIDIVEDIDDIVEEWHQGNDWKCELHEFLGWSWEQYQRWGSHPADLPSFEDTDYGDLPTRILDGTTGDPGPVSDSAELYMMVDDILFFNEEAQMGLTEAEILQLANVKMSLTQRSDLSDIQRADDLLERQRHTTGRHVTASDDDDIPF